MMWDVEDEDRPQRRKPTQQEISDRGLVEYEGHHYSLGSADPVTFYEDRNREPRLGEM